MAIQQKYRKGHPMRQLHRCLGYQKDQAGNLVPDKNAELVRQIFQMAADGWSISQITKYLNENKITTQNDRIFSRSTVSRILHNHAYKGDYICQRYYVNNQRKLVRNKGEKQMYYIRHDHLAIVSEEMWETAQEKLAKKSERNRQGLPSDEIAVTKKLGPRRTGEKNPERKIPQKEKSGLIPDKPPLTLANYPYKDRIFCKYCGSRLRRIIARNHSVWWICNGLSRKGKAFAKVSAYQMKSFPASEHQFFSIYRKGAYRWKRNLRLSPPSQTNGNAKSANSSQCRVAAYCRVSTEQEEQLGSFANQIAYYTDYINEKEEYQLAGIFSDEGFRYWYA
ncbi:MAG: recombinase family protein [Ruminococcus sp.]